MREKLRSSTWKLDCDRYAHCLDCGDVFMGIYKCPKTKIVCFKNVHTWVPSLYTFYIWKFFSKYTPEIYLFGDM